MRKKNGIIHKYVEDFPMYNGNKVKLFLRNPMGVFVVTDKNKRIKISDSDDRIEYTLNDVLELIN